MDAIINAAGHTNPAEASADQIRLDQLAEIRRTADRLGMAGPRSRLTLRGALLAETLTGLQAAARRMRQQRGFPGCAGGLLVRYH
jgi:hypothetical protein